MGGPEDRRARLDDVLVEIEGEARRQRTSVGLPVGYEAELDGLFTDLTPQGDGRADLLRQAVAVVDRRAVIDLQVPVASRLPGGDLAKRAVRRLVGWYVRFLLAQVARFASAVARVLHLVESDLAVLRASIMATTSIVPEAIASTLDDQIAWWAPVALAALDGAPGRVLHADCGAGSFLGALRGAGIDAFGTDPSVAAVAQATAAGFEARSCTVDDELAASPPRVLGGLVLQGSVQWRLPGDRDRVLRSAVQCLAPGGVLVVASTTPEAWDRCAGSVLADLAPCRPIHPETWAYLLEGHGLAHIEIHRGGRDIGAAVRAGLGAPTSSDPGSAEALMALVALVDLVAAEPDEYVVVATLGR